MRSALLTVIAFVGTAGTAGSAELPRRADAPAERFEKVTVELGAVRDARDQQLRTLTTVPREQGRRAGILLVGWLSCDSVELRPNASDGTAKLLRQVIEESGAVVMRVDKPGVGDSEGSCVDTDFETELSGYRAAFDALRSDQRVDPARIVLLGISNGGGVAPLVANGKPVAGYISIGGWSKTWFEHMIELERRRLALAGKPREAINAEMKSLSLLHAKYLLERRTPGDVIAAHSDLKAAWYDEPAHQYGRPAAFYHQLQALDLAAAWSKVTAPTLVVWGEYDWIMSHGDQVQIVDLVNASAPGRARLLTVPQMDHGFSAHPNARAAFEKMGEGGYPQAAADEVIRFLRKMGG
jgi:pimeloyl-ACP methyl ester carboxylesterase